MKKKWRVPVHPEELKLILCRHVFGHIEYSLIKFARACVDIERTLIPLLIVIKCFTWHQIVGKIMKITIKERKWQFNVAYGRDRRKRAHNRARAHFSEML